ncbi:hypothetical protein LTR22_027859 [Elasticomyces elasticus]|nr:hypothetical protein LTR22_027859 [Elasticomyces elasticus]KAK5740186.1 hypothetical protein LTS12_025017 [Elasticomyces elasticus]
MASDAFAILRTTALLDITLDCNNPRFQEAKRLARFNLSGKEYVLKSEFAVAPKKASKERSSPCWRFGEPLIRMEDKKEVYYCYHRERANKSQRLPVICRNAADLYHMEHVHDRDPKTGDKLVKAPATAAALFNIVEMAFFMLENAYFRELLTYLNKSLAELLPRARSTLRGWIMSEYLKQKALVVARLRKRQSKAHLTFDIWTAGSYIGKISVYCYFIGAGGKRERRLLAFRRIYGSRSGENQAEILLNVIKEYGLTA